MRIVRDVVSVGVIVFLLLAILPYSASRVLSTEMVKTLRFHGKSTHQIHNNANPFYVSKRKIPNGADPIHNRRAETSRLSPRVR